MNLHSLLHHNSGGAILFLDGVPLPFVLQRLNVQRNLPKAPKLRRNAEGDRAKAKAKGRAYALAEHAEQKDWEQHFKAALNWSWRKVEQELRSRGLTFSKLRDLANVTSLAAVPA
jgi:hypothetical protein